MPRFGSRTPARARASHAHLRAMTSFGDNPGALSAWCYVPEGLPAGAPLVVALHGCGQDAASYDLGAGWSALAELCGFAVLLPEQRRANNANGCFNWFEPGDTARGHGEVASIAAMVAAKVKRHKLDPRRVFVTGLSAGGAMAAALCATYPDLFAGGAVVAGLPYGSAFDMGSAFAAMASPPETDGERLANRVRAATGHDGDWPRLSIWHGDADRTVAPANGAALAAQWAALHGARPGTMRTEGGARRQAWHDAGGTAAVEMWTIPGMGHGVPIASAEGGKAGPFILDVGIASSRAIADFWGIATVAADQAVARAQDNAAARGRVLEGEVLEPADATAPGHAAAGIDLSWQRHVPPEVNRVINDALRAAGLMR